jgi:hypothetical protein
LSLRGPRLVGDDAISRRTGGTMCHSEGAKRPKNLTEILRFAQNDKGCRSARKSIMPIAIGTTEDEDKCAKCRSP